MCPRGKTCNFESHVVLQSYWVHVSTITQPQVEPWCKQTDLYDLSLYVFRCPGAHWHNMHKIASKWASTCELHTFYHNTRFVAWNVGGGAPPSLFEPIQRTNTSCFQHLANVTREGGVDCVQSHDDPQESANGRCKAPMTNIWFHVC